MGACTVANIVIVHLKKFRYILMALYDHDYYFQFN